MGFSQNSIPAAEQNDYNASLYGFVRSDFIFDSRKSLTARENELNLYPLDIVKDVNGKDINAVLQSNFLAITSRFGVKVKGPDVWGSKISGTIEGDFYATLEANIGSLRLRHAFINMEWTKTTLTLGQTWYPTFITEVSPGVVNFNAGILFNPFGWAPQVRVKQSFSKEFSITATAYKEGEFSTANVSSTLNAASINSPIPTLNAQIQYKGKHAFLGAGVEYKSIQPLTDNGSTPKLVTTETVNSTTIFAYGKYFNDLLTLKAYGISGQNLNNLVMLGGFTGNTVGGIQSYDPTKTKSFWLDLSGNGKSVAPGLFFGTTKNDGASVAASTATEIYGRGVSGSRVIDDVWRLSGRIDFKKNKFRVAPELEYTAATYGDADLYGKATTNKTNVNNFRTMVACVYTF